MKLLYCDKCKDVFKLQKVRRECLCGNVHGMYLDDLKAEVSSTGYSLAIGNGSLVNAIADSIRLQRTSNGLANREDYIDECSILAWARPNYGLGNPHTKQI